MPNNNTQLIYGELTEYVEEFIQETDTHVVVLHSTNCQNTMGSGAALSIANTWPEAKEADMRTTRGDRNKLGSFSSAAVHRHNKTFTVVNLYSQYRYGPRAEKHFDVEAFEKALRELASFNAGLDITYVFPKISAGSAGGNWKVIMDLINDILGEHPRQYVRLTN